MFYVLGGLGICWELYIYVGYYVFFYYDLMIGKFIIYGESCDEVIVCMCYVFEEIVVEGIKMNIFFQCVIMVDENFFVGGINIYYLEKKLGLV